MGIFSRKRRTSWEEAARSPLPPDDPIVRAYGEPGEVFLPGLGVINWKQYVTTLNQKGRRRSIRACFRTLVLSDQRLLVLWRDLSDAVALPLQDVLQVELIKPQGKLWEGGEIAIRITCDTHLGSARIVDYATSRKDAEAFAARLRKSVAESKVSELLTEHGGEVSLDSPDATEMLQLMVEAGEAELPPIIRDRKTDTSNLRAPVSSWKQCPECGSLLKPHGDAVLCPECTRVWCDPHRWPALDEDGDLLGTQPYAPSPTEMDQGIAGKVSAWFLTTLHE